MSHINTVWKFPILNEFHFTLENIPEQSKPLCVRWIDGKPYLYLRIVKTSELAKNVMFTFVYDFDLKEETPILIFQFEPDKKIFAFKENCLGDPFAGCYLPEVELEVKRGIQELWLPATARLIGVRSTEENRAFLQYSPGDGENVSWLIQTVLTGDIVKDFGIYLDTCLFYVEEHERTFVHHYFRF